jgi:hypothetical protein
VLVDRTPEIVLLAVNPEEHLVEVPGIARSRPPPAQLIGEAPAEFRAPAPDAAATSYRLLRRSEVE